jgi:hypothetical protein
MFDLKYTGTISPSSSPFSGLSHNTTLYPRRDEHELNSTRRTKKLIHAKYR